MKHRAEPSECPYRYDQTGCPDVLGPAAGDIILVGIAGDTPEAAQAKILARRDDPEAPAPLAPIVFHIGQVTRVRRGRIVRYRDVKGRKHRLEFGPYRATHVLYTHREAMRIEPTAVMTLVAKTRTWAEALDVFGRHIRASRRRCRHTHR